MADDDGDDVVVLRVCANNGCMSVEDLHFDEESGEMYCGSCRDLFVRAEKEGFHILLSQDDVGVVRLIFDAFDKGHKGFWTYEDYNFYQDAIEKHEETPLRSSEELYDHFKEEFDLKLTRAQSSDNGDYVVTRTDLEDMYGGYLYNNVPALKDDADHLAEAGFIHLGVLE